MGRLLESSAERRLQAFRRELTLDLYTRHGAFWEMVSRSRELWGIEPEARIPPIPQVVRVHLPSHLLRRSRPDWPIEAEESFIRWQVQLEHVHHAIIPPEHRVEGVHFDSADFWDGFLSACLIYDPPADDLLGFADHPVATYGEYLNILDPSADPGDDAPQMLAPPVRFLYDMDELLDWVQDRYERLIAALHKRLEPRGIDVQEMVYDLEYFDASIPGNPDDEPTARPYIQVAAHTTEADVRNAYKLLVAHQPQRPRAIKPRRDPLTAVQCAIWYDDLGWSHVEIADRFGWTVQTPAGSKPKSETARQHIADGRKLLRQRKVAA